MATTTQTTQEPQTQLANVQPVMGSEIVSPKKLKDRITQLHQLVKEVFERDVHFGTIPGCGDKPALLKSGAEMACAMFRLVPRFDVSKENLEGGHREVTVTCSLYGPDNSFWGQGLGMATTMESKHRYRGFEATPTDQGVPRSYWDAKNSGDLKQAQKILGGNDRIAKKINGQWTICIATGEKQENADPADQWNTVLKMSKKRALVDAVLTATGMSALFTQDMGDLEEMIEQTPSYVDPIDSNSSEPKSAGKGDAAATKKTSAKPKAKSRAESIAAIKKYIADNGHPESAFRVVIGGKKLDDATEQDIAAIRDVCQRLKGDDESMNEIIANPMIGLIESTQQQLDDLPDSKAASLLKGLGYASPEAFKQTTDAKQLMLVVDTLRGNSAADDDIVF